MMGARLLLVALALLGPAQDARYAVCMDGEEFGVADYDQRVHEDGNLRRKTAIYIRTGGPEGVLSRELAFRPDGTPISIVSIERAYETNRTIEVTYVEKAAKVVVLEGGSSQTKVYPAPRNWQPSDPSAWWFVRDTPQPGTKVTARVFDEDALRWVEEEIVYAGQVDLQWKGGSIRAAHIQKKPSGTQLWLDAKGDLLKLVTEQAGTQLVLERKN